MRMPPAETNKSLTADEIELIRRWIEQGADWKEHWSLIAPERPSLPEVQDPSWPRNEIDRFILKRLEQEGLKPAPEADKTTLIRRVTFDLTGLPPTTEEVDAFLADDSPDAYERLVDRLQQSPHYGEHQARFWLDAARYGDTHGLHLDNYREMWPYRDWVVNAFNANLPYDRFVIEQLAGDLLPDATQDQLIATGFNRCHVTTNEGGSIVEEVRVRNVVDRVVTTGTVFMGMTFDCTRCHDHKYDPFTMNDFYSLFAFFNSMDGSPMDGNRKDPAPVISVLTDAQKSQIAELRAKVDSLQTEIRSRVAGYEYVEPEQPTEPTTSAPREIVWIEDEVPAGARAEGGWQFVDSPVHSGKKASKRTSEGLSQHFFTGASEPLRVAEGDRLFAYVYLDPANPPKQIMMQFNDGSWEHRAFWGGDHIEWGQLDTPSRRAMGPLPEAGQWARLEVPAAHVGLNAGAQINGWAFTQFDGTVYWDKAGIVTTADQQPVYDSLAVWWRDQRAAKGANLPDAIRPLAQIDDDKLTDAQRRQIRDHFVERVDANTRSIFAPLHQQADDAAKQITQIESSAAITLIYREAKAPRPAQVLNRGEYDQPLHEVPRATPPALPPLPEGAPLDRLGLAQWLVAPRASVDGPRPCQPGVVAVVRHRDRQDGRRFRLARRCPQPSRTAGLAGGRFPRRRLGHQAAAQDVGDVGRLPPEFPDDARTGAPRSGKPAAGPRAAVPAGRRDAARPGAGGQRIAGPPDGRAQRQAAATADGLWFAVGYSGSNTVRFVKDEGPDKVHRRTLYTFIKRTAPPPQMSTFDAPSREACTVRRERTNTPLQALLLLNDPQYFEAARMLGQHILRDGGETPEAKAAAMFRACAARPPKSTELAELLALYEDNLRIFQDDPDAAKQMIAVGESKPDETLDPVQSAAWTVVANTLLNLDEVLTKN
jgi:hypothetical protein